MADEIEPNADRHRHAHQAAADHPPPGPDGVGDPADDRSAERRSAQEGHEVQGHDAAAERGLDVPPDLQIGRRREREHGQADQHEHERGAAESWHRPGDHLQQAEAQRREEQEQ